MEVFGHGDLTHIIGPKMINRATAEVAPEEDFDVPDLFNAEEKQRLATIIDEQVKIVARECGYCGYSRVDWVYSQFKGNRDDWRI